MKLSVFSSVFILFTSIISAAAPDCQSPQFEADFLTYSSLESGTPNIAAAGILALAGDENSAPYQRLKKLAQKDQVIRGVWSHVDILRLEMKKRMGEMEGYRKLFEELNKTYEVRFGKDWANPKNASNFKELQDRKTNFMKEFDIYAREKGWPRFQDYFAKATPQSRFDANFESTMEKSQSWQIPEIKGINLALSRYASKYLNAVLWSESLKMFSAMEKAGLPISTTPEGRKGAENNLRRTKTAYENAIVDLTEASATIAKSVPPIETPNQFPLWKSGKFSAAGVGLLGVLGTGALGMATSQNAEASILGCQKKYKIEKAEIPEIAYHVDGTSIPSGLDRKIDCNNIRLMPTAITELKKSDGNFSPGLCNLLSHQMNETQERYSKDFDIDLKNCDHAELKVNGQKIGQFIQVDADHYYFEVPPQSKGLGARFHVQYNGGTDFDPQTIQCFRNVGDHTQPVSDCTSNIRNALLDGSDSGQVVSVVKSRRKLFHSQKICEAMNSTTNSEPFCVFSKNTEAIRQAFSLLSMKCMNLHSNSSSSSKGSVGTK